MARCAAPDRHNTLCSRPLRCWAVNAAIRMALPLPRPAEEHVGTTSGARCSRRANPPPRRTCHTACQQGSCEATRGACGPLAGRLWGSLALSVTTHQLPNRSHKERRAITRRGVSCSMIPMLLFVGSMNTSAQGKWILPCAFSRKASSSSPCATSPLPRLRGDATV